MAAQPSSTSPSTYIANDGHLMRVRCIHAKVTTKVLYFVFRRSSSDRPVGMSLLDYYNSKGIPETQFKRGLHSKQIAKIRADPDGTTFDITLLCSCLRKGSHGLADENSDLWIQGNTNIESLIFTIKNKRNNIAHEEPTFTNQQLVNEANEIRNLLTEILNQAGQLYQINPGTINQEISDMDNSINNCISDDLTPQDFEEYKQQLLYPAQSEYVNKEGVEDVLEQYDKSCEGEISTVNHIVDISLPVEDIYTEMRLQGESASGQDTPTAYEDILKDENHDETYLIIVINGVAGAGKTTLIKKVLSDWRSDKSIMKYLLTFDHVLKVECRNMAIKSFDDLLHHLMPKTARNFKSGHLKNVMLGQKLLVILDGLDELNQSSAVLFEEVLQLKKDYGISVMITTRPEKLKYLEQRVNALQIKIKVIQLLGVLKKKRDELVIKYHTEIAKKYPDTQDIGDLLNYLKRTEHRLSDLWRLPYNLTLLTILWAYDHMNVNKINTAPELYQEIYRLYRTKLKERLRTYRTTQHFHDSELERIIDCFIYSLARESLIGLKNDQISLPLEAYQRLASDCVNMKVPIEEMISAFLKRIPSIDIVYGFAHKGLQDFLAAMYIWMEIIGKNQNYDIEQIIYGINNVLSQNSVDVSTNYNILKVVKKELKRKSSCQESAFARALTKMTSILHIGNASTIIKDILQEIHGTTKYDITKFQNILISLLGIFYLEKNVVQDEVKLEALKLLQETGVRSKDAWITILNSVKCDEYAASFISKQPNILGGHIQIRDSSLFAYISLMQTLTPPLKDANKVSMELDIYGDLRGADKLLELISLHSFKVKRILITDDNFIEYTTLLDALTTPLKDSHEVNIDVNLTEELLEISDLMIQIKMKNFNIKSMQVKDSQINDSNFSSYTSMFRSLPNLSKNASQVNFEIDIKGSLTGTDEMFKIISSCQLKVKQILINDNNFTDYTSLLKSLTTTLRDPHEVNIDLLTNQEMPVIGELIEEIKNKNFRIRMFQVKDFQINDFNYQEYVPLLQSLPSLLKDANQTSVDIDIKANLTGTNKLLELMAIHQFKVTSILISDTNSLQYTEMLKRLSTALRDADEVKVDIHVNDELLSISELLKQVKLKHFTVRRLDVRNIQMNDNNYNQYYLALKSMPMLLNDAHEVSIDMDIKADIVDVDELLQLIAINQFKVKRIYIYNENFMKYTRMLRSLSTPLKDACEVNIDINVEVELPALKDLMLEIKKNQFLIKNLALEKKIHVDDDNLSQYISILKSLPTLERGAYNGVVYVDIKRDSTEVSELLMEISRNCFALDIQLHDKFRHPTTSASLDEAINSVSQRSVMLKYLGYMPPNATLPNTIQDLCVSIGNLGSYNRLREFLQGNDTIEKLDVCLHVAMDISGLSPIPLQDLPPALFITDVTSAGHAERACTIAKSLKPISLHDHFWYVWFPRASLNEEDIENLLRGLKGVEVVKALAFPSTCKPSSLQVQNHLEQLARTELKCSDGIHWGWNGDIIGNLDHW